MTREKEISRQIDEVISAAFCNYCDSLTERRILSFSKKILIDSTAPLILHEQLYICEACLWQQLQQLTPVGKLVKLYNA